MRGLIFLLGMGGLLPLALTAPMAGVLAYYWISFMSPQMDVGGIAAAPPWALLSVLATLLGCLVAREPKRMPRNGMVMLVVLFLILTTISTLMALGPLALLVALTTTRELVAKTAKAAAAENVTPSPLAIIPAPIAAPAMARRHWEARAGAVSGWRMRRLSR